MTKLISISGSSGAGKTEIGKALMARIPSARFISFDDHEDKVAFPASYPASMPEEYGVVELVRFISGEKGVGSSSIILDYPFGRANKAMSSIIDSAVYLRVPLDVSMARRTRRELRKGNPSEYAWLLSQLEHWEKGARDFCVNWETAVSETCDLVVDAMGTVEAVTDEIVTALELGK